MSKSTASLLLLLAAFVWGAGFIGQETAMDSMGPFLFCGLRFLIAGLVLLPFAIKENSSKHTLQQMGYKPLLILGCVFFLGMILQQIGIVQSNATKSGFITGIYVVMVPLLLLVFWKQKLHYAIYICCALVIFGLYFLSTPDLVTFTFGDSMILVSTVFWGLHIILIGIYVSSIKAPFTIACGQFLITGSLSLLFHFALAPFFNFEPMISYQLVAISIKELLFTALVAGVIGFGLQIVAQQYVNPTLAAIILSLESLFAAILGFLILGEQLPLQSYFGCAIIFFAVIAAQLVPQPKMVK